MSIDEPLELTQSNANHNTNINACRTNGASNSSSEQLYQPTSFAIPHQEQQTKDKQTDQKNQTVTLSNVSHNDNVSDSVKNTDSSLSTNATPAAKAAANRENLGPKINSETLDEKKKKLTLSLVSPPTVGSLSSISSDSNNNNNNNNNQFPVVVSTLTYVKKCFNC